MSNSRFIWDIKDFHENEMTYNSKIKKVINKSQYFPSAKILKLREKNYKNVQDFTKLFDEMIEIFLNVRFFNKDCFDNGALNKLIKDKVNTYILVNLTKRYIISYTYERNQCLKGSSEFLRLFKELYIGGDIELEKNESASLVPDINYFSQKVKIYIKDEIPSCQILFNYLITSNIALTKNNGNDNFNVKSKYKFYKNIVMKNQRVFCHADSVVDNTNSLEISFLSNAESRITNHFRAIFNLSNSTKIHEYIFEDTFSNIYLYELMKIEVDINSKIAAQLKKTKVKVQDKAINLYADSILRMLNEHIYNIVDPNLRIDLLHHFHQLFLHIFTDVVNNSESEFFSRNILRITRSELSCFSGYIYDGKRICKKGNIINRIMKTTSNIFKSVLRYDSRIINANIYFIEMYLYYLLKKELFITDDIFLAIMIDHINSQFNGINASEQYNLSKDKYEATINLPPDVKKRNGNNSSVGLKIPEDFFDKYFTNYDERYKGV